jgi:hypothetical protein
MSKLSAQARARKIKLLLFDLVGALTDGKLFFVPEDSQQEGALAIRRAERSVPDRNERPPRTRLRFHFTFTRASPASRPS